MLGDDETPDSPRSLHERATALFLDLRRLTPDERAERLASIPIEGAALREAVLDLLAGDSDSGGFLAGSLPGERLRTRLAAAADAAESEPPLPDRVGSYRILRLLGRGGMGAVYEAEQENPRRRVALKVVLSALAAPEVADRLRLEAQLQARLAHPGIAQVYEAGVATIGGARHPFIAMELVLGETLLDHSRRRELSVRRKVELVAQVADAADHAHVRGIVHRDLKPANVLVDGEGRPRILDFGIARAIERGPDDGAPLTGTGQVLGTIPYMSPEQFAGAADVGRVSDVYSLGVLLFELLSGRLPHDLRGLALHEAAQVVREREPATLSSVLPGCDRELELICSMALEKDPGRRYATAGEMADDLRRYLRGEAVRARPASAVYLVSKFARRHRTLVAAVALAAAALVAATLVSLGEARRARAALAEAERSRAEAESKGDEARRLAYRSGLAAARRALDASDSDEAERYLNGCPENLRAWEWRHAVARLDRSVGLVEIPGPARQRYMRLAPIDPAGNPRALGLRILEGDGRETIARIDVGSGRMEGTTEFHDAARPAPWLEGLTLEFTVQAHETSIPTRAVVPGSAAPLLVPCRTMEMEAAASALLPLGDPHLALVRRLDYQDESSLACDFTTGRSLGRSVRGNYVASHREPTSRVFAMKSWTGTADEILLVDASTLDVVSTLRGDAGATAVSVDEPRDLAYVATNRGSVGAWSISSGRQLAAASPLAAGEILATVVAPDGDVAFSVGRAIELWAPGLATRRGVLFGHRGIVQDLLFLDDGRLLASAADDGVRTWDPRSPDPSRLVGHGTYVYSVAFAPDGQWLVSGGWDGCVRAWSAASGRPFATLRLPGSPDAAVPIALWLANGPNTDGSRGAASLDVVVRKGRFLRLSLETATWTAMEDGALAGIDAPALARSLDGRVLVGATYEKPSPSEIHAVTFDTRALERGRTLPVADPMTWTSPDRFVARVADVGQPLRERLSGPLAWLDADGHELARLDVPVDVDSSVAADPRTGRVAIAVGGRPLVLWNPATGARIDGDRIPRTRRTCVAWSPDGSRVVVGTFDGAILVLDGASGAELVSLRAHAAYVYALAWSPDGRILASASGDGTIGLHGDRTLAQVRAAAREEVDADAAVRERVAPLLGPQLGKPADLAAAAERIDGMALSPGEAAAARRAWLAAAFERASTDLARREVTP